MKLNSKLTGGLAWAGLIVILAVPSADMLTRPKAESASHVTSDMDAIRTASVEAEPAAPVPATRPADDPVDAYLASGKKLPSYISDAQAEVADKEPATAVRLVVPSGSGNGAEESPSATEVASVASEPAPVAPVPYPAWKRPKPPVTTAAVSSSDAEEEPLVIDEQLVARREAAVARVLDDAEFYDGSPDLVTGEELEEWDSGSLAEYLERRGLMDEDEAWQANAADSDYDEDGFFLDEGPNSDRRLIRRVRPGEFFFF